MVYVIAILIGTFHFATCVSMYLFSQDRITHSFAMHSIRCIILLWWCWVLCCKGQSQFFCITNDGQLVIIAPENHMDITSKHLCCYFTVLMSYHNHRLKEFVVCPCFFGLLCFQCFFFWFVFVDHDQNIDLFCQLHPPPPCSHLVPSVHNIVYLYPEW